MSSTQRWSRVLVDTGPLVAILDRRDSQHARCVQIMHEIQPPLLTCWPVLTEAAWLLRFDRSSISRLILAGQSGWLRLLDVDGSELSAIDKLLHRYHELSPQLADLTLLYLAQRDEFGTIFTLDRRDFSVFRRRGKSGFNLLPDAT